MSQRRDRAGILLFAATVSCAGIGPALAQQAPVASATPPSDYVPARTPWGDPDFRGTWPMQNVSDARIRLERPAAAGGRAWLTDEEFAGRLDRAKQSDAKYSAELSDNGTKGLAQWLVTSPMGRRSSLIVSPADGQLPPLTPAAKALFEAGRNSWKPGQAIDWVDDLDTYERCVSYGMPMAMLPHPGNDGIRVFQSPGFVAIQLEVFGTRIVPLGGSGHWPAAVRGWLGDSRGHWEGDTLVIETANLVAGDSATHDMARRSASPVTGREHGTIPMSAAAHVVERLTMTGPDAIDYRVTYSDPEVFTAPWTVEFEWTRDDSYQLYEYACHEGNTVRELINASRAQRRAAAGG